jgi:hypothetical protein
MERPPVNPAPDRPRRARAWPWALGVGIAALAVLGSDLAAEPEFADEWAYVSQAFYVDLLAQPDHPLWLDYPALDLPPLPKYLVGAALKTAGYPLPPPASAVAWYRDTSSRAGTHAMLTAARWPSVACGAIGCVALFAIGTLARGRALGLLAAALLLANPLYRMLARRAMADAPTEALVLTTAAIGLWAWKGLVGDRLRPWAGFGLLALAGIPAGLAVLAKLNGGLGLMTLGAWAVLGAALVEVPARRRLALLGGTAVAGAVAFGVFVLGNPLLTAAPRPVPAAVRGLATAGLVGRTDAVIRHRLGVPRDQQTLFPDDALETLPEKAAAVAVQGFGRFGPLGQKRLDPRRRIWWFDSTRRYDWAQDAGAVAWLPAVLAGAVVLARRGRGERRAGGPPASWAVLVQAGLALLVVTAFLPLAWDRYFLGFQPGASLLGAAALLAAFDAARSLARRAGGRP